MNPKAPAQPESTRRDDEAPAGDQDALRRTANADEEKDGLKRSEKQPPQPSAERPPAGPHAKPELTNKDSAPGSGLLPDPDDPSDVPDSTSG